MHLHKNFQWSLGLTEYELNVMIKIFSLISAMAADDEINENELSSEDLKMNSKFAHVMQSIRDQQNAGRIVRKDFNGTNTAPHHQSVRRNAPAPYTGAPPIDQSDEG